MRHGFAGWALVGVLALGLIPAGAAEQEHGEFVHVVLFWLKPEATAAQKQQLIDDCHELLGAIESVTRIEVGVPAGTPREVVDNSYDVALVVYYRDVEGHNAYQVHEKHDAFVARNRAHWERVQIYDLLTTKR